MAALLLQLEAGDAWNPRIRDFVQLGLPWGTKPRLILAHLNAEAIRRQSPVIEVEASLSAFVKRIRGFDGGREIRAFKNQLSRLSVALVRLATTRGDRAFQVDAKVVTAFELWPELDERQRVLWPTTIQLSLDYFNSLQEHAVPLNEADLAALAHSAMALDPSLLLSNKSGLVRLQYPILSFHSRFVRYPWSELPSVAFRVLPKRAARTRMTEAPVDARSLDNYGQKVVIGEKSHRPLRL